MGHEDAGHYAAKHAPGTLLNPQITELVKQRVSQGKITCSDAHRIAHELNVPPAEVGVTIDLLEIKISRCQLGLFGYGQKNRIVQPAKDVSPELKNALENARKENRISCVVAWELAKKFGISRIDIAAACEALQIKISSCQLGTF
jgi:hypothetical protein